MATPPTTPVRSPKRKMQTPPAPQTPRTREDILREKMAITPPASRYAKYLRRGVDALDALAAVASSTPPSPSVSQGRRAVNVHTPKSAKNIAVRWLNQVYENRPEMKNGWNGNIEGSQALRRLISDDQRWQHTVELVEKLSNQLVDAMSDIVDQERMEQAVAIFFASLENVLVKEEARLQGRPKWIIDNLVKATPVYKSLLVCSFDVTAAAYGHRDLSVFLKAIQVLQVPPIDIVKVTESFIRLPEMPRSLATHIITCSNRVLDSMAWKSDSKLVQAMKERATEKAVHTKQKSSVAPVKEGEPNGTANANSESKEPEKDEEIPKNAVREFTLEFFYKKMLSVASERAQELLILLSMDAIADQVWASLKHAVWERWHLMVDRHLDQIIMCCIYGVAKVRRYELKFREIIQAYQSMSHVREQCFAPLLPGVFRDVSLDAHLELVPMDEALRNIRADGKGTRGDIIKLYNQVFIHSMKAHILQFQVHSSIPPSGIMSVRNLVGQTTTSTADCATQSSTAHALSASNSVLSSIPNGLDKSTGDTLNEKVMSSPMRMLRPHASPRRIGRVTVSPMSPGGRSLVAIRQSPGRRAAGNIIGSMTPGTRKLYAFGESPVKNLERINRSFAESNIEAKSEGGSQVGRSSIPLSFEGNGIGQRKASMRRRMADALPFKALRQGGAKFAKGPEEEGEKCSVPSSAAS